MCSLMSLTNIYITFVTITPYKIYNITFALEISLVILYSHLWLQTMTVPIFFPTIN